MGLTFNRDHRQFSSEPLIFNALLCYSLVHPYVHPFDGMLLTSGDQGIFFWVTHGWTHPSPISVQHVIEALLKRAAQAAECPSRAVGTPNLSRFDPALSPLFEGLMFMHLRGTRKISPVYLPCFPAPQLQAWTSTEILLRTLPFFMQERDKT